jgi:hypothetical protein
MIEADFEREYRIDLLTGVKTLTWRRFLVLLAGLSVNSMVATALQNEYMEQQKSNDNKEVITDTKEGENYVWGIFQ